jgi:hypothetical protein
MTISRGVIQGNLYNTVAEKIANIGNLESLFAE